MKKDHPFHDDSMWKGANPDTFAMAQRLRGRMTEAESKLWNELKDNKLEGIKFRRQHPIHKFIVDFYCHKEKLIIEVDGKYHEREDQKQYDEERSDLLIFQGMKVLRFSNEEVIHNMDKVLERIKESINS